MLFEVEASDYCILTQLTKQFWPYSNLQLIASDWANNLDTWLNNSWDDLDDPAPEKFVEDSLRVLIQTQWQFKEKDITQILKISELVKEQLEEFRPKVPLIFVLRKQGMKERHWLNISDKTGKVVKPGPGFTFQTVLDMELIKHFQFCAEIGEKAAKEFQIKTMLNQMTTIWQDINFELNTFKNTFILKNYDDINQILDEHIVKTQTMQFSPNKKLFEAKILYWYQYIQMVSDILEVWVKKQCQYKYLQLVFDSADIMKQFPRETKEFKAVDQIQKKIQLIWQKQFKMCQKFVSMKDYQNDLMNQMQIQKLFKQNLIIIQNKKEKSLQDSIFQQMMSFQKFFHKLKSLLQIYLI